MGLREADEVSDGPSDHMSIAMEETIALLRGSNYAGNVARYRGLFRYDCDCLLQFQPFYFHRSLC
ncbi:hypothetical protein F183_A14320 [Bryobacterales bacterium F-183]|nr:hypothetical protein F183_A14320 [Bryobacterales bacterium F-183]